MSKRTLLILGTISLMILAWTPLPAETQKAGETDGQRAVKSQNPQDNYLVGAGDVLNIVVWKNEDLSGEHLVRPDGKTTLPLIGDIVAAGMSTDAIAMQISKKLELFIENPFVTVILLNATSNRVYVLGEVKLPGVYPLQDRLTVIQALALAGGLTEFAKKDRMVVIRQSNNIQVKYDVNYKDILKSPNGGQNLLLERGDTLVVP